MSITRPTHSKVIRPLRETNQYDPEQSFYGTGYKWKDVEADIAIAVSDKVWKMSDAEFDKFTDRLTQYCNILGVKQYVPRYYEEYLEGEAKKISDSLSSSALIKNYIGDKHKFATLSQEKKDEVCRLIFEKAISASEIEAAEIILEINDDPTAKGEYIPSDENNAARIIISRSAYEDGLPILIETIVHEIEHAKQKTFYDTLCEDMENGACTPSETKVDTLICLAAINMAYADSIYLDAPKGEGESNDPYFWQISELEAEDIGQIVNQNLMDRLVNKKMESPSLNSHTTRRWNPEGKN